jgi:hypothetical protein
LLVFHARDSVNEATTAGRHTGARVVHYGFDGEPLLYMTADRLLKPEYQNPELMIIVGDDGEQALANADANSLSVPATLTESIYLPATGANGSAVTWQSTDDTVITDSVTVNENYDDAPAGMITRGTVDKTATLTAAVKNGSATATRTFNITVKANADFDFGGYLYAYFRGGVDGSAEVEQVHFAISEDGLNWKDLNGNRPVLTSAMGTTGLRDMYLMRAPGNDKIYLMATDLWVAGGGSWTDFAERGSKDLMVWETTDLVNWSPQRAVTVANEWMGCAWAPESIYDPNTGEYLLYFSAHRITGAPGNSAGTKAVYVTKTRDFINFSEPELFVGNNDGGATFIDTTMALADDGKYYRITKNEGTTRVFTDSADKPLGPFTAIDGDPANNNPAVLSIDEVPGVEGPGLFKLIEQGVMAVMLDQYAANGSPGWIPFTTDNIAADAWTQGAADMPTGAKHGGILAVSKAEYAAIIEKWGSEPDEQYEDGAALEWLFDDGITGGVVTDTSGNGNDGAAFGGAAVTDDAEKGAVLNLTGADGRYVAFPAGFFDNRENATISFDIYNKLADGYHFEFALGNDTTKRMFLRMRSGEIYFAEGLNGNTNQGAHEMSYSAAGLSNRWMNVTIVFEGYTARLYVDGQLAGSNNNMYMLSQFGENLNAWLGRSLYSADPYSNAMYDNVKVYWDALTDEEITDMLSPEPGIDGYLAETDWTQSGETVSAATQFTNGTPEAVNGQAVLALYDGRGRLVTAKTVPFTAAAKSKTEILGELSLPDGMESYTVKAFFWESDTYVPLTPANRFQ